MFYSLQYQTILPLFHIICNLCIYHFIYKNETTFLNIKKSEVILIIIKISSELVVNFRSNIKEFGYPIVFIYKRTKFAIGKMTKTMSQ